MKITYLTLIILSAIMILMAVVSFSVPSIFIEEGMGHGGSFIAAMALMGIVVFLLLASAFGLFAFGLGYVYQDKLPDSQLYRIYWSALLTIPGFLILVVYVFPAINAGL